MREKVEMEKIGLHLGYPTCCVDMFLRNCHIDFWWERYAKDHWAIGTGYIPCPFCAQRNREEVESGIRLMRKHQSPWPEVDFTLLSKELSLGPNNA